MAGTRFHEEKQRSDRCRILSDDKHEKKDAETTQTYKLKRHLNSVLSDPQ